MINNLMAAKLMPALRKSGDKHLQELWKNEKIRQTGQTRMVKVVAHKHIPHNSDVMQTVCEICGQELDLRPKPKHMRAKRVKPNPHVNKHGIRIL